MALTALFIQSGQAPQTQVLAYYYYHNYINIINIIIIIHTLFIYLDLHLQYICLLSPSDFGSSISSSSFGIQVSSVVLLNKMSLWALFFNHFVPSVWHCLADITERCSLSGETEIGTLKIHSSILLPVCSLLDVYHWGCDFLASCFSLPTAMFLQHYGWLSLWNSKPN